MSRHEKLSEIFSGALAKAAPEERSKFLDKACGEDRELRQQVEGLLLSWEAAGDFLRKPLIPLTSAMSTEKPGTMIDRYKLLQVIGEGGCGVVYMAEQEQPIRRRVALKIIKLGMDTRQVVARFEAERQALAMMDHPNIAKVLDAGATAAGRPYFVMELVRGEKITDYCDRHKFSVARRLELFIQVCYAVQHAHQKGIIHRDLKPSNILVTEPDGVPLPKVIDFGIAKAAGAQRLTEKTLFTAFEQFIGTPAYMSPEQTGLGAVDVDTRSDIYSLGVLLYELLTGHPPFDSKELSHQALDEVFRIIRETEPPLPSTRLTTLTKEDLTTVAQRRQLEPAKMSTALEGDLDWIILKAMEKDRRRRYDTSSNLARDIERHLAGDLVLACPPSASYRFGKFIRRHKIGAMAAAIVLVALIGGLVLALAGFAEAKREQAAARYQAAIAEAVSDFLRNDLLAQASPERNPDRDVKLRTVLDQAAARIGARFEKQPSVEAAICRTLGETYLDLGELNSAEPHLRRAAAICSTNAVSAVRERLASQLLLGRLYRLRGQLSEAETVDQAVLNEAQSSFGSDDPLTWDAKMELAQLYSGKWWTGNWDDALRLYREVFEGRSRLLGPDNPKTLDAMKGLTIALSIQGKYEESLRTQQKLVAGLDRSVGSDKPETLMAEYSLARIHFELGEYGQAETLMREVLTSARRVLGEHDFHLLTYLEALAEIEACLGHWQDTMTECQEITTFALELEKEGFTKIDARWTWPVGGPESDFVAAAARGAEAALLGGHTNEYRAIGESLLLAASRQTNNTDFARQAAEACLLAPDVFTNRELLFALSLQFPQNGHDWLGTIVRGLAEYRLGNLQQALTWLETVQKTLCSSLASEAGYICAMARFRLGDTATAQSLMNEANETLANQLRTGRLGFHGWHEYARAAITRTEAEQLILGRKVTQPINETWITSALQKWKPIDERLTRFNSLGSQGKWVEAYKELLAAVGDPVFEWKSTWQMDDNDNCLSSLPARAAIVTLLANDVDAYRQFCQVWSGLLQRFPPGSAIASQWVISCLIGVQGASDPQVKEASAWVSQVDNSTDDRRLGEPFVAFRSGNYEEVISLADMNDANTSPLRLATRILRAMALAKLGRLNEGRRELRQVEIKLAPYLTRRSDAYWADVALCRLLLAEAHRLFGPSATMVSTSGASGP